MSRKSCGVLLLGMTLLSAPLWAAEGTEASRLPLIKLRSGEHTAYDRIVFDVPKGVSFKMQQDGADVRLAFSIAAQITLRQPDIKRAKSFSVVSGREGREPLIVGFRVAPEAKLKTATGDGVVIVDVYGSPASVDRPASIKKEVVKTVAPEVKQTVAPPMPEPASVSVVEPEKSALAPEKKDKDFAPTPAAAPVRDVVRPDVRLEAPAKPLAPEMDDKRAEELRTIAREKEPQPILSFDPNVVVGAAVFVRAGYVTVIFDRKISKEAYDREVTQRFKANPFELPYNSGFRFAVPEGVSARATREETRWNIYLAMQNAGMGITTEFLSQPEFALGARLLLPTIDPPEPVFYTDPIVGDRLLVLPLRENSAFTVLRRMSDFQIIPAAQGLVIKPWHERVVVRVVPDGLELTSEGGLKLSSPRDTGAYALKDGKGNNFKSIFAFDQWRGRIDETFSETRQKLLQTVVDVPKDQRILARMDLARFYFAHGMGREASALLDVIGKSLPEVQTQPDFLALRGASRILAERIPEGEKDLENDRLSGVAEVTLWQAIGSALSRDWSSAIDRFRLTFALLEDYPEPFRSRFIVLAVESAFAAGDKATAGVWLDQLEKGGHAPAYDDATKYLKGVLWAMNGKTAQAGKLWHEAADGKDRLYKIRAELALVDLGVATKSLTFKQAVDRLEGLRFAWRGDNLEFDILRRLGGFYLDAREPRKGLLVFGQALRLYPDSPLAPALQQEMKNVFKEIFLSKDKPMPPLEALGLYTDFKNLIPEEEDGNKVRRVLAERLVDIDLLDQAGDLLTEIIQNSTNALERAQTGARLAAVRLLDHKAQDALAALDRGEGEAAGMGEDIRHERAFLRVRALSELGRYEDALTAMPPENNEKAKLLRADIAMRAKKWDDAALALLSLVGTPPNDGETLPEDKAEWVVNIALALAQGGDLDGLSRLADAYGPSMQQTSRGDVFQILTRPDAMTQTKDLAAAQRRLSEVDMFKGFLDAYRKGEPKAP